MDIILGGVHEVQQVKEHPDGRLSRLMLNPKLEHLR